MKAESSPRHPRASPRPRRRLACRPCQWEGTPGRAGSARGLHLRRQDLRMVGPASMGQRMKSSMMFPPWRNETPGSPGARGDRGGSSERGRVPHALRRRRGSPRGRMASRASPAEGGGRGPGCPRQVMWEPERRSAGRACPSRNYLREVRRRLLALARRPNSRVLRQLYNYSRRQITLSTACRLSLLHCPQRAPQGWPHLVGPLHPLPIPAVSLDGSSRRPETA